MGVWDRGWRDGRVGSDRYRRRSRQTTKSLCVSPLSLSFSPPPFVHAERRKRVRQLVKEKPSVVAAGSADAKEGERWRPKDRILFRTKYQCNTQFLYVAQNLTDSPAGSTLLFRRFNFSILLFVLPSLPRPRFFFHQSLPRRRRRRRRRKTLSNFLLLLPRTAGRRRRRHGM